MKARIEILITLQIQYPTKQSLSLGVTLISPEDKAHISFQDLNQA